MPIDLTVSPHYEILGNEGLDQVLAVCRLEVRDRWEAGEMEKDGSVVLWPGFSVRLSNKSFDTITAAVPVVVACLERYREEIAELRDHPAVYGMTLFLHLACPRDPNWTYDSRPRLPRRITEPASELGLRVQVHAVDGRVIA
jgi:hypothetical protein